jgi:hypothetical protein
VKALLPLLVVLLASCTSTTVDEFRQGETGINSDESIVILGRSHSSDYETRAEFVDCVGERMTTGNDSISVIPEKEFVDAMFPWFEPRTAPLRTRDLERLMAEPVVADKMAEFGVRYMVWLDGFTETSGRTGTISCTVGPAARAVLALVRGKTTRRFDARVWDVASLQNVGTISTDATGQSYLPALVIPIPLIARVEANACVRLADQLKQFVNGE